MEIGNKNIFLLLIRSTHGIEESDNGYKYPKNDCDFIIKTIISIILLPFTYVSHLMNLIYRNVEFNGASGFIINFIGSLILSLIFNAHAGDGSPEWCQEITAMFSGSQRFWIIYLLGAPFCIIAFFIIGLIVLIIGSVIDWCGFLYKKIRERFIFTILNKDKEPILKKFKEKNCKPITYK